MVVEEILFIITIPQIIENETVIDEQTILYEIGVDGIDPSNYDLDQFNNASANPFVRADDPALQPSFIDYLVAAVDSETISATATTEIDKLIFSNGTFLYRKSTDTTDAIFSDAGCTTLVINRYQNI